MTLPTKWPEPLKAPLANAFYGGALGDALGFLVELQRPEEIATFAHRLAGNKEGCLPWLKNLQPQDWLTHAVYPSGQVSDDTQLTHLLMHALAEGDAHGYNTVFRANLAQAFANGNIYSYGHTTKKAAEQYMHSTTTPQGSISSTSNGSVMRIVPIGIYFSADLNTVATQAYTHSQETHAHPAPCTAAQAQALAAALLVQSKQVITLHEKQKFVEKIALHLTHTPSQNLYLNLIKLIQMPLEEAKACILTLDAQQGATHQNGGISMDAVIGTLWAHVCFLNSPREYWQTLTNALSIGGDVDTVAAMAGALSGLYNSHSAFPSWYKDWLKFKGSLSFSVDPASKTS